MYGNMFFSGQVKKLKEHLHLLTSRTGHRSSELCFNMLCMIKKYNNKIVLLCSVAWRIMTWFDQKDAKRGWMNDELYPIVVSKKLSDALKIWRKFSEKEKRGKRRENTQNCQQLHACWQTARSLFSGCLNKLIGVASLSQQQVFNARINSKNVFSPFWSQLNFVDIDSW